MQVAIAAFLAQLGASARANYRCAIAQFFGMFDWMDPAEVTIAHVAAFKKALIDAGRADGTVYARLSALSSLFAFLTKPQFGGKPVVAMNPFEDVNRSDVKPTPYGRAVVVDWVTFQKILDVIPPTPIGLRDKALLLFFAFTGRRRREVANLRIRDVDLKSEPPSYTVVQKGGEIKRWALPMIVRDAVEAYWIATERIGDLRPDSGVFTACRDTALTEHYDAYKPLSIRSMNEIMRRWVIRAGLDANSVHVHSLRHMAARDLDRAGVRLQDIQDFLGHKSPTTTSIYTHRLNKIGPALEDVLTKVRAEAAAAAKTVR